jgi:pimeloyl-ACP methyl ester carboxylesterase
MDSTKAFSEMYMNGTSDRRSLLLAAGGATAASSGLNLAAHAGEEHGDSRMERLATKYRFNDKSMDLFFVVALGWGYDGGLDIGAAYYIASKIKDGDADSWVAAFGEYGEQQQKLAEEWKARGWNQQAAQVLLKSFSSYRSAWQFAPLGPVFDDLFAKHKAAFKSAITGLNLPATFFNTPYKGKTLPGVFLQNPDKNAPVLFIVGGADTCFEELFLTVGRGIFESGYSVAMADLPGQGITMKDGLHWEIEAEMPISAHVDYLVQHFKATPGRIAFLGYSLGGYFACRAAGYEPRFATVIASTPFYYPGEIFPNLPKLKKATPVGSAAERNYDAFYWKAGASSDEEFVAKTAGFISDPARVTVPFLSVVGGGEGKAFQEQAKVWHEQIKSTNKRLVVLDASTGADGHVQAANRMRLVQEACGWMGEVFRG